MSLAPYELMDGTVGSFLEKDYGNYFEFSNNTEEMTTSWLFPHIVWVTTPKEGIDSGWRYARVLKTVAYIAVDEDAHGQPIIEKWNIKQHKEF